MSENTKVLKGHKVVGGKAKGKALVSQDPLCFLGGVDPETGQVTEKGHPLEGEYLKDKVLVFPIGKGSTGGSYLIYATAKNGKGPLAVINVKVDSVTAIGCILAEIPMVAELHPDPLTEIKNGDWVEVDGSEGEARIIED